MGTVCPRRLSFSGFGVLMSTPNPEKDSLRGQTVPIQKPLSIFEITGFFSPTLSQLLQALIMGTCEFCGIESSSYRGKHSFRRHVQSHHPTTQQCNQCNQTFETSKQLEWHRKSVHSALLKCPCCGKTFKSKTAMIMHQQRKITRMLLVNLRPAVMIFGINSISNLQTKLILS